MRTASAPRRTPTGRPRGRPPGTTNAARAARAAALAAAAASEPPPKKRRYIPGGPGGGGRFVEIDEHDAPATTGGTRTRAPAARAVLNGASPSVVPRERSMRSRASASEDLEEMRWGSAAAVAASVKQAEDYKPREERSWEEFHPNLDIEKSFVIFTAEDVDGMPQDALRTPLLQTPSTPLPNGSTTPSKAVAEASAGTTPNQLGRSEINPFDTQSATPTRRSRRPIRDAVSFFGSRSLEPISTPRTPKIMPIPNQTAKERLDLKLPSYRKTNRIELFESKTFGQARYVDKAMSNVGYQESDEYIRPDSHLIKAIDANAEDDLELGPVKSNDDHPHQTRLGRVEYDMDEQDDTWLEQINAHRKDIDLEAITREVFEITMTKIEKEWHSLEKRIPKPNPKPPQTHRPRSGSAAAVNGETQSSDEPDSKCAICDDGDCENTNAIVFCDGCNLAVHQECYGVPFIPEGQWLCRKCQLCGRGIPTCIFCPNTDGAFKQTNSSKWAHLLCAMWIPEVSLGNHTFMEPVMDVEKVPKTRWKLSCYICRQRMGACIQCSNKNCYQAFHVTCARRAHLYLKMKTSHGALAVLDGGMVLKAFCDKHCPPDYTKEHNVYQTTRSAKKFYKRNMRGRIWADNLAIANVIAAQQRTAAAGADATADAHDPSTAAPSDNMMKDEPPKNMWKLPSGAPIIPRAVFDTVEAAIQRFPFRKRKDFLGEACRYWTLKREARRGAGLLKRLQLQMETFSSMELTRRDFSTMGPNGKARLERRLEFAQSLIDDLEQLKLLSELIVEREQFKVDAVALEDEFVDEVYFPVAKHLSPMVEKAMSLDKDLFSKGLEELQARVDRRVYVTVLSFAQELGEVISDGIAATPTSSSETSSISRFAAVESLPSKPAFSDIRDRRKVGKRILKAIQPMLEMALKFEAEISGKPMAGLQKDLEALIETSLEASGKPEAEDEDTIMVDAPDTSEITVKGVTAAVATDSRDEDGRGDNIEVNTSGLGIVNVKTEEPANAVPSPRKSKRGKCSGLQTSETTPDSSDYDKLSRSEPVGGPPTPPQSNGSLGKEPSDPLSEGGVLWYMRDLQPRGTSIVVDVVEGELGAEAGTLSEDEASDPDEEGAKVLRGAGRSRSASNTSPSKARKRRTSGRRR